MTAADFTFSNAGSYAVCTPRTDEARQHLLAHLADETQQWGVVVEFRYVETLSAALVRDGFTVATAAYGAAVRFTDDCRALAPRLLAAMRARRPSWQEWTDGFSRKREDT